MNGGGHLAARAGTILCHDEETGTETLIGRDLYKTVTHLEWDVRPV